MYHFWPFLFLFLSIIHTYFRLTHQVTYRPTDSVSQAIRLFALHINSDFRRRMCASEMTVVVRQWRGMSNVIMTNEHMVIWKMLHVNVNAYSIPIRRRETENTFIFRSCALYCPVQRFSVYLDLRTCDRRYLDAMRTYDCHENVRHRYWPVQCSHQAPSYEAQETLNERRRPNFAVSHVYASSEHAYDGWYRKFDNKNSKGNVSCDTSGCGHFQWKFSRVRILALPARPPPSLLLLLSCYCWSFFYRSRFLRYQISSMER